MTKQQGIMNCPMCNCLCKSNNVGFYNCYYNIFGTKFDEKTDDIEKFGTKIPNLNKAVIKGDKVVIDGQNYEMQKTENNKFSFFNEASSGKSTFVKLIFQVIKF